MILTSFSYYKKIENNTNCSGCSITIRIRRKVLTAMHDGMSTFFIVTTSDLIGQDSKTAKKLGFKVHFV